MQTEQKSKVLKWSLIIGMVIVLNLFFNYALSLAYNSPEYNDFCKVEQVIEAMNTKDQCLSVGGQWNANAYKGTMGPGAAMVPEGYCDQNFKCGQAYTEASNVYDRNVFVTLVVLGVLALAVGFKVSNEAVSKGLSLGGVLSFVIASMRYWSSADDLIKLAILAVALAALVWLAYRKFGNA